MIQCHNKSGTFGPPSIQPLLEKNVSFPFFDESHLKTIAQDLLGLSFEKRNQHMRIQESERRGFRFPTFRTCGKSTGLWRREGVTDRAITPQLGQGTLGSRNVRPAVRCALLRRQNA